MGLTIVSGNSAKIDQIRQAHRDSTTALNDLQDARTQAMQADIQQLIQQDAAIAQATNLVQTTSPITGAKMSVVRQD